MKNVDQSERWLAWFIRESQCSEAERDYSAPIALTLQHFAKSLQPHLEVDWEADVGGPSPAGPLVMGVLGKQERLVPIADKDVCLECGRPVTKWRNSQGQGFCAAHEAKARKNDAENQESADLWTSIRAANPPRPVIALKKLPSPTDCAALFREILDGLNSYLNASEWTFPSLKLEPRVTWGAEQPPSRFIMAPLRDAVLWGISDLLLRHGHKIQTCAAEGCGRYLLSIRRQSYCSPRCSIQVRHARFRDKLNKKSPDGFKKRRHQYYAHSVKNEKEKKKLQQERRERERAQSQPKVKAEGKR
jgi:hypothetical protein